MKHISGPWWAEGRYIAAKVSGGRPNGEIIAIFSPTADSLRSTIPNEANAMLGAAAPDLLEACKALKSIIDNCEPYSEEAINQAGVAIKKAEGEM